MKPLLDCHIVFDERTDDDRKLERLLRSLRVGGVEPHVIRFDTRESVFKRRILGFKKGVAPWVTFADPDDEAIPEGLERLVHFLVDAKARFFHTLEQVDLSGKRTVHENPHHFLVGPREAVETHYPKLITKVYSESMVWRSMGSELLQFVAYTHYRHDKNTGGLCHGA